MGSLIAPQGSYRISNCPTRSLIALWGVSNCPTGSKTAPQLPYRVLKCPVGFPEGPQLP